MSNYSKLIYALKDLINYNQKRFYSKNRENLENLPMKFTMQKIKYKMIISMPKQSSYKIKYLSLNSQLWHRKELSKSSTQKTNIN